MYNATGQRVQQHHASACPPGQHRADILVDGLPAGIYELQITTNTLDGKQFQQHKRLIIAPR